MENGIDDLSDMATIVYYGSIKMWNFEIDVPFASGTGYIDGIVPGSVMSFKIEVRDDPNYENARSKAVPIQTLPPPTESWLDHTEPVAVVNGSVTVSTAGQLAYLAKEINSGNLDSRGLQVTLANDIDLTGYLWEPIGNTENTAFKGDFYGDMHTVSGMYADGIYSGLFGITDNALLENVQIKESYVYGLSAAGSIAGVAWNNSLIRNCVNRAIVTGENETGGIVGILGQVIFWLDGADFSKVDGCINYGNISGVKFTGGIVGRTYTYTYIGYTINRAVINCINYETSRRNFSAVLRSPD